MFSLFFWRVLCKVIKIWTVGKEMAFQQNNFFDAAAYEFKVLSLKCSRNWLKPKQKNYFSRVFIVKHAVTCRSYKFCCLKKISF